MYQKISPPAGPRVLATPGPPADIARTLRALAGDASRRERAPHQNKCQAPRALNPALAFGVSIFGGPAHEHHCLK
jgi:hypothetical protein